MPRFSQVLFLVLPYSSRPSSLSPRLELVLELELELLDLEAAHQAESAPSHLFGLDPVSMLMPEHRHPSMVHLSQSCTIHAKALHIGHTTKSRRRATNPTWQTAAAL